jgi:hypothetical protein
MFDFENLKNTDGRQGQVALLGTGLADFFQTYPEADTVPLAQAGAHAPFSLHYQNLARAISWVSFFYENNGHTIKLDLNGEQTTLGTVLDRLKPYATRIEQGLALEIFNNLANSPTPGDDYKMLQHLVGRGQAQHSGTSFAFESFTPETLAREAAEPMALAYLNLSQRAAMQVDAAPLEAWHQTTSHLAAFRQWNKSAALSLQAQDISEYLGTKFKPACKASARARALELMTQPPTRLLDRDGCVDTVKRGIEYHLEAAGVTISDIFTEGAKIGGQQLSQTECVNRYHAAMQGLEATQQVYMKAIYG